MGKLGRVAKKAEQKVVGKLTKTLELPKEVVMNLPFITITGNEDMIIENYKGVVEYSQERVRINTNAGIIRIEGKGLVLKEITSENIGVYGTIKKIEFLR
jgi:sporulation protein YqfC